MYACRAWFNCASLGNGEVLAWPITISQEIDKTQLGLVPSELQCVCMIRSRNYAWASHTHSKFRVCVARIASREMREALLLARMVRVLIGNCTGSNADFKDNFILKLY